MRLDSSHQGHAEIEEYYMDVGLEIKRDWLKPYFIDVELWG